MGNTIVHSQLKDVKDFLSNTVLKLEDFLNETTLSSMEQEIQGSEDYNKTILSNLRKLLVSCEEGLEACKVVLQGDPFSKPAAEKTLFGIYYHCIEEFFSPRSDVWYEDSRSAYTGKNSIKFRQGVTKGVGSLMAGLEGEFQRIREELEYYETDYRTKILHSK
ncbi:DUF3907 family protein [Mesobacillus harenae]|uniref:DUF3907 family protein n=1 Tax=Mesobacillus harenae TaxID=2213203 RepID=UPI00158003D2